MARPETHVLSLGGSVLAPDGLNARFLSRFKALLKKYASKGHRFIIVVGGGQVARHYQSSYKKLRGATVKDRDWIGIYATWLNARVLRHYLKDLAAPDIVTNVSKVKNFKHNVLVAAGDQPGHSTDYQAVLLAKKFKVGRIFNLTNTDYVYSKDPAKHQNAVPLTEVTWPGLRRLVGSKWRPAMHAPFDPVAAKLAASLKLRVAVINGQDLDNLDRCLVGRTCRGTIIG